MNIRILVNGCDGKMGQLAMKALANHPDFIVLKGTGRQDDLATEIKTQNPKVVLDFTNSEVVHKNVSTIISLGANPVIGTTGLLKEQIELFEKQCAELKLGALIAPNFSLGAILLMKTAQEIVKYFPQVEIIEMHHAGKLDSPSGTAIHTAELLADARLIAPSRLENSKETIPGAKGANYKSIPIHAVRLPGLVAHEQVIFGGTGETLSVSHNTIDRQCFMPGVILACQKVVGLSKLVYGLENIL